MVGVADMVIDESEHVYGIRPIVKASLICSNHGPDRRHIKIACCWAGMHRTGSFMSLNKFLGAVN